MAVAAEHLESYLGEFTELARRTADQAPEWLRDLRDRAFARFCDIGFPTTRDEDWRFTNISSIARIPFALAGGNTKRLTRSNIAQWQFADAAAQLVFVDGQFDADLSSVRDMPAGVIANSLRSEIVRNPDIIAACLGRHLDVEHDAFSALNTAFTSDGAYIQVPAKTAIEQPIHLLFISTSGATPVMTHPRNLIIIGKEAQATVVEDYVSFGADAPSLSNVVTELLAGESANVAHMMIEREHGKSYNISTLRIEQARSANVASHSLLLGGGLVRNNVHPLLAGEGAECLINGLYIGSGRQHLDNYMLVEHASPHCASRQFYNGILDGQAHGVFHGRIIVHKDAQKTDAKQTNRNLLLTDDAQIDTKPQLEIHADDVKCTHGATIGQIEESALFYLRSRGLSEVEAKRLLVEAFAGECLERIESVSARGFAQRLVEEYLRSIAIASSAIKDQHSVTPRRWEEGE